MQTEIQLLQEIRIASPCEASWEEMSGDERSRFCEHCQLNVYNLSEMTALEAAELVRQKEGRLCARYYARPDGSMLTQDCPVGFRAARRRFLSLLAPLAAGVLGLLGLGSRSAGAAGSTPPSKPLIGAPVPPPQHLMGKIAAPPPRPQPVMGEVAIGKPPPRAMMGEVAIQTPHLTPKSHSGGKKPVYRQPRKQQAQKKV
jgi:hypothetical protein